MSLDGIQLLYGLSPCVLMCVWPDLPGPLTLQEWFGLPSNFLPFSTIVLSLRFLLCVSLGYELDLLSRKSTQILIFL